jgi:hypothetical protein
MNKETTCRHCGKEKPYSWLGGHHCDYKGIMQPEVWWLSLNNSISLDTRDLQRSLFSHAGAGSQQGDGAGEQNDQNITYGVSPTVIPARTRWRFLRR